MNYKEIKIGAVYSFERIITKDDVLAFAKLTGDYNKIHVDEKYGSASPFGRNIVHGMLAGSLFSALIGMHCPGENSLYLSQTLNFRLPVFCGDRLKVKGTVMAKNDSIKVITLKMEIMKNNQMAIDGEAMVKVLV